MATSQNDKLASINSATLGANMPVITLADGSKVQTGKIGALLVNIKAYDKITSNQEEIDSFDDKIKDLEDKFKAALPLLKRVGLLDIFPPEEWIAGSASPGRKRVGELVLEVENTGGLSAWE